MQLPLLFLLPFLMHAVRETLTCRCGKVLFAVDSPDVLRLVCYCKDCRGYHQTLNAKALATNMKPAAPLDNWGGVDWTHCYPSQITVLEGKEHLVTRVLHPKSSMYRVYSSCCHTPLFSLGQGTGSALVNTDLLRQESKPDVRFRIIGRQALDYKGDEKRPKMSWSVPLSWFWVMSKRINKDLTKPSPVDVDHEPKVMEDFKQG